MLSQGFLGDYWIMMVKVALNFVQNSYFLFCILR